MSIYLDQSRFYTVYKIVAWVELPDTLECSRFLKAGTELVREELLLWFAFLNNLLWNLPIWNNAIIVGQSCLSANIGFGSVHV